MMQKVNTVFVGKKVNAAGTTLAVGDIVAINAATGAVIATANIATAEAIQLGYVRGIGATDANANIVKTQVIGKNNVNNITADGECAYVAKTEAAAILTYLLSPLIILVEGIDFKSSVSLGVKILPFF